MSGASDIVTAVREQLEKLAELSVEERIEALNELREMFHEFSPFMDPVDTVRWVPAEKVVANDYNPNRVAPPEMQLLKTSIECDGFTQPIVAFPEGDHYTVVDGFHRNRVGREYPEIRERMHGHLPLVVIEKPLSERMASTIRHNRARGTHAIQPMSRIIEELYFMGWSDKRIAHELGMERDEILRLKQFTGLGRLFKDREFSWSWV